jgi:hypothetical protein
MSKKQLTISNAVMSRINREHITMKPKWYFVVGSLAMAIGLFGSTIISIFLVSVISFSLRTHGPMGEIRYQQLLSSFPWWAPIIAVAGLGLGVWFLHKYDFSYKKNFVFIVIAFVAVVLLSGFFIDYFGIDTLWARRGPMMRFYQQGERNNTVSPRGRGRNMMQQDITP